MKGMTSSQRRTFFLELRVAAREVGEEPEAYRKRIMMEELGVEHLAEVSRGTGFDRLMSRVWTDRGDYVMALDYAQGSFSRLRHLIVSAAERIVASRPDWQGSAYDYLAGVMHQCGMLKDRPTRAWTDRLVSESGWLDFTEPQMRRLLMMLNTYVRRR